MIAKILLTCCGIWTLTALVLFAGKRRLLQATWHEPYCGNNMIAIESDDWGPGPAWHSERIRALSDLFARHRDSFGRPAVMTANLILATPDIEAMRESDNAEYRRRLIDASSPEVVAALQVAIEDGTFAVQLHGLEHCYGPGYANCVNNADPRLQHVECNADCYEWETLDSRLQAHFVDGSRSPSVPVSDVQQQTQIQQATELMQRLFGIVSRSAVAPCYLWDDVTERLWREAGVEYIQTAGYRCNGRGVDGAYIQDKPIIRAGDRNECGQTYLVRTVMYEPKDGRGVDSCIKEAAEARRQALPIVISTHRYNYTDDTLKAQAAMDGLDTVLRTILGWSDTTRFVASDELGAWIRGSTASPPDVAGDTDPPLRGFAKIHAFLARLWFRHQKLRWISIASLLIIPAYALACVSRWFSAEQLSRRNPVTP